MSHDESGSSVREPRFKEGDRIRVVKLTDATSHIGGLIGEVGCVTEYHGLRDGWPWYYLQVGHGRGSLPEWCLIPA